MHLLKSFIKGIADFPRFIVYIFRYWEYVDWRVQTAFYIICILLMVGTLAVIQGKV